MLPPCWFTGATSTYSTLVSHLVDLALALDELEASDAELEISACCLARGWLIQT